MGPLKGHYSDGQTPLDPEQWRDLKIEGLTNRKELDEFEQRNIEQAISSLMIAPPKETEVLTERFLHALHQKMFGKVWKWAGKLRTHETNIGVDWWTIPVAVRMLLDDANFWRQNETFGPDEWAIRIKHRLVSIHLYPNGNGRHSRLFADVLVESHFGRPPFSWGKNLRESEIEIRNRYLKSLREADRGDFQSLIDFSRS